MKIRKGFVSNSSTTSFIIGIKNEPLPCPICGRKDPDILELIEQHSRENADTSIYARGKEDVLKNAEQEDETVKEKITNFVGEVAYVGISYHDDLLNKLIHNMENIKIFSSGES